MANVFDVAKYILEHTGEISTMKLQKLCYYSQAWSLVWDDKPLYENEIQAWRNGPVIPDLFSEHRGLFLIIADELQKGDSSNLNSEQKETIDAVLRDYGSFTGGQLSQITHSELSWISARDGYDTYEYSNNKINLADIQDYYTTMLSEQ